MLAEFMTRAIVSEKTGENSLEHAARNVDANREQAGSQTRPNNGVEPTPEERRGSR
jgi:hypothetical protein